MVRLVVALRELLGGVPAFRPIYRRLPSRERCKVCLAPFQGLVSLPFRMVGIRPSRKNPHICTL
jgi:adenylate cyclase